MLNIANRMYNRDALLLWASDILLEISKMRVQQNDPVWGAIQYSQIEWFKKGIEKSTKPGEIVVLSYFEIGLIS